MAHLGMQSKQSTTFFARLEFDRQVCACMEERSGVVSVSAWILVADHADLRFAGTSAPFTQSPACRLASGPKHGCMLVLPWALTIKIHRANFATVIPLDRLLRSAILL
jgi:hypothetical protein